MTTKQNIQDLIQSKQSETKPVEQPEEEDQDGQDDPNQLQQDDDFERFSQAEDFEDYKVDGYYPVTLGESFNEGKYVVIQKLGWGHFSTVWLVQERGTGRYHALKIQKSQKSYSEAAIDELEVLNDLLKNQKNPKWLQFIAQLNGLFVNESDKLKPQDTHNVRLRDSFSCFGIHGKHYCSVFEVMGPSLLDLIQHFEEKSLFMPLWLVKHITKQILLGLIFMHDSCDIIHTDLKPQNVMIEIPENQYNSFIQQLKQYKQKPLSMKYLQKLKQSNSTQNKKKYDKKKKKKAQKKETQSGTTDPETPSPTQTNSESSPLISSENIVVEMTTSSESEKQQTTTKPVEQTEQIKDPAAQNQQETKKEENQQQDDEEGWEDVGEEEDRMSLVWKNDIVIPLDINLKIKIVDFGNACWTHKHYTDKIQTREYRSPEAILGIEYLTNTDIFSLACMIFEMITNCYLFKPERGEGYKKNDDHLSIMQETLGKMPTQFALSGQQSRDFFNKNGQLIKIKEIDSYTIKEILIREHKFPENEAVEIQRFLLPMLEYDPKRRLSAIETFQSAWLWS